MLRAIASGQPEAAGRAMFEHAIHSKDRMVENETRRRTHPAAAPD
jgi:DNA-binding FadR family transcriptional regulator